jgi:hypothetical protein
MAHSGPELATASGFKNNCGFHCIAHTLLALTDEQLIALSQANPIYQAIAQRFYDRYDIQGDPNFEDMLRIVRSYPHPFDHEILLGPVLRETLRGTIDNPTDEEREQLQDWHQVEDQTLAKLTKLLGFDLYVIPMDQSDSAFTLEFPVVDGATSPFEIRLTHIGAHPESVNGVQTQFGHFNFSFPDERRNVIHNQDIQLRYGADHEFLDNGAALFNLALELDNFENLQRAVKSRAVQILGSQMDSLFDVRTQTLDSQMESLFDLTTSSLNATHQPSPSKPMYHPKADDKKIEDDFLRHLKEKFKDADWNYNLPTTGYNLESKADQNRRLNIAKQPDGMVFSAIPEGTALEDIALAASAYKLALAENNEDIEFEMNVADEAECRQLLNSMMANQLELGTISTIRVNGLKLTEEQRNELIEQSRPRSSYAP